VTQGPGLVGALLIGVTAAKTLAYSLGVPVIPVHHVAGHIYANQLVGEMQFPLVSLVVSGGHTELILMRIITISKVGTNTGRRGRRSVRQSCAAA